MLMLALRGLAGPAMATPDLPALTGEVILVVTGLDPARFPKGEIDFDAGRLRALGHTRLRTSTIWTDGVHEFGGVLLKDFVAYLDLSGGTLRAQALNDYAVDIPVSDGVPDGPLLAYEMDGEPMSARDKGPLWIVYPYDQNPEYRSEVTFTRSIWQLDRIEVER
jgi:hypothetical protein